MKRTDNEARLAPIFDRALARRDDEDYVAAIEMLRFLLTHLTPDDQRLLAHTHLQLGYIYRKTHELEKARHEFAAAVGVAPTLELASMCLFHAILDLGDREGAMEEMLRFLRLSDSEQYRELLSDGYGDNFPDEQRRLAEQARLLLNEHENKSKLP